MKAISQFAVYFISFISRKDTKKLKIMKENCIAKQIVDAAFQVHQKLGSGLLESVYKMVLGYELEKMRHCY